MRDGSGHRSYKFLHAYADRHGKHRIYFRRKGQPKVALEALPGTPQFEAEYQAALMGQPIHVEAPARDHSIERGAPGSFRWLCAAYCASADYKALNKITARRRKTILDELCESKTASGALVGTLDYKRMEARHVLALADEKKELPEAANMRIKTLRRVYRWACDPKDKQGQRPLTTHNPARDVSYRKSNNEDGFYTWTRAEIAQYQAHWHFGTKARLALDLFFYTGVRVSDAYRLGPQMERAAPKKGDPRRWLYFTEYKGRNTKPKQRAIPILPALRESIDATRSGHLAYIVTEFNRPHSSAKSFSNRFKKWCEAAGLPHCSCHGMRKAAAVIASENGADHEDLKAMFGWTSYKQADHYIRKARLAIRAGKSMQLLALHDDEDTDFDATGLATEPGKHNDPVGKASG